GQQLARGLASQHVAPRGRLQQIGRVGLTAAELLDAERAGKSRYLLGQISLEPRRVEAQRRRNVLGARIGRLAIERGGQFASSRHGLRAVERPFGVQAYFSMSFMPTWEAANPSRS